MSVATRNPFALLNDDDVGEPTPSAPSSEPAPPPEPKAAPKDQKRAGPASRGGRYYQRGGGAKNTARETQDNEAESAPRENRKSDSEVRGRGRGGRGGRGRGAGGRGRQYDRHSGTLPDSDKKVNQGWGANEGTAELTAEQQGDADAVKDATVDTSANWGGDTSAADNTWGATTDTPAETGDTWGGAVTDNADNKDVAVNGTAPRESRRSDFKEEEEDNSLTLDEYLAQKAKAEGTAVPKIEAVRRANEGVDESLWKDAVPLSKAKEEDNYFVGKTKSAPKARAKKEEKVHIEIEARFERPDRGRGRGGRGGRGGDRGGDRPRGGGGRGRGGPRGGAHENVPAQQDVNVADQSAFPSLA
ncbi:hypothetical protein K439DRAFT_1643873 [Ramaria rubella]|nr:hypothetical protein K439DRAFT_1643873 [Ramaria rubella]